MWSQWRFELTTVNLRRAALTLAPRSPKIAVIVEVCRRRSLDELAASQICERGGAGRRSALRSC